MLAADERRLCLLPSAVGLQRDLQHRGGPAGPPALQRARAQRGGLHPAADRRVRGQQGHDRALAAAGTLPLQVLSNTVPLRSPMPSPALLTLGRIAQYIFLHLPVYPD